MPVTKGLMGAPNVLITPHIGGTTADLADDMIPVIVEKICSLVERGTADNIVNRAFLEEAGAVRPQQSAAQPMAKIKD